MIKLTKKARDAAAKAKRDQTTANLREAAEAYNKMTPAQKKAARKWGKK